MILLSRTLALILLAYLLAQTQEEEMPGRVGSDLKNDALGLVFG